MCIALFKIHNDHSSIAYPNCMLLDMVIGTSRHFHYVVSIEQNISHASIVCYCPIVFLNLIRLKGHH